MEILFWNFEIRRKLKKICARFKNCDEQSILKFFDISESIAIFMTNFFTLKILESLEAILC